jgi:isoleucyl-tRNA synthetase
MKAGVVGKAFADNRAIVTLDTNVTEELRREGMARDFVRLVQNLRKEKDFNVSDRIELVYSTDNAELVKAIEDNKNYVAEQVLAVKVETGQVSDNTSDIEGVKISYDAKQVA